MESKSLLLAIERFSGIAIKNNKSRKRPVIDAKKVYCKIMRDFGNTYEKIGNEIGIDHSTVVHHCKDYDYIKKFSTELGELEREIIDYFNKDTKSRIEIEINTLSKELDRLTNFISQST
jgi:predicted transcriptional regulator